jgi:colanic acid biosynthesis glycosyl transferase WcaI
MKILVVGMNYDPEIISTAVYSSGMADFLSKTGHQVQVITALPYYPAWKIMQGWPRFSYRFRTADSGAKIAHCPLYVPAMPSGLKRILHHLSFALTALPVAIWRAATFRPDLVLVVAPSLISAPVAKIAALICGAKTWLHIQDFEVEAAFATGLLHEHSVIGRWAKRFERWQLAWFDKISTISPQMIAKLLEKGVAKQCLYEFRNWANIAKISPMPRPSPLRAELGITSDYVVLYSGNLANKQGLEIIPEIAAHLAHRSDITFAICGDGPVKQTLITLSKPHRSIRFFPLQPVEKLSALLAMADVHLLPQIAGAADLMLPSKLTNMLASGRPILATALQGTALADEVGDAGIIVAPGDAAAAAAGIEMLLDNTAQAGVMGKNARARARANWDSTAILARFEAEICALLAQTGQAPAKVIEKGNS